MNRDGYCCDQPTDAPCTVASPPTLAGVFEVATPKFDDPLNLVLPLPRRAGYYPAILGVGYARDDGGLPLVTPLHDTYIAFEELDDTGAAFLGGGKYILVNSKIRFFSILSDGERSVVPPFNGGGAKPYGLVITSVGTGEPGQLRAYLRFMPRTSAYPGLLQGGL
jgi:hypothetical protein